MYERYNPNPCGRKVGDCVIRAISKATRQDWYTTYTELAVYGLRYCDMPSSNSVWGKYLNDKGYFQKTTPYITTKRFCEKYPKGTYILATGTHVICVEDGKYYDAWDSGEEVITYYFEKEKKDELF